MAFTADFDSPKTASGRTVNVIGLVPASTAFVEVMQLSVSRINGPIDYFYLTKEYTNSTLLPISINETLIIAAVPKIGASDLVTFTSFGSILGQVDIS